MVNVKGADVNQHPALPNMLLLRLARREQQSVAKRLCIGSVLLGIPLAEKSR